MTLKEARKEIKAHVDEQWEEFEKTGSLFCQGYALGGNYALAILNEVDSEPDTEPVVKDRLTLGELAHELREIFAFSYLVAQMSDIHGYYIKAFMLKPDYLGRSRLWKADSADYACLNISFSELTFDLDLSEYKDENGNVDYSKCIVEVE